ncbi:MAG TPA: hypothetical protein VE195_02945 [Acidobacteriaceae bacterium]|nr:hypothetical protein [Acidobacteriaceae bacterium]
METVSAEIDYVICSLRDSGCIAARFAGDVPDTVEIDISSERPDNGNEPQIEMQFVSIRLMRKEYRAAV